QRIAQNGCAIESQGMRSIDGRFKRQGCSIQGVIDAERGSTEISLAAGGVDLAAIERSRTIYGDRCKSDVVSNLAIECRIAGSVRPKELPTRGSAIEVLAES